MKNNIIFIIFFIFFADLLMAENLKIESSSISIDKQTKLTIFKDQVKATDNNNNIFTSEYAEYNKELKLLISKGDTKIVTSEGYTLFGKNIVFDNKNNLIKSNYPAKIIDLQKNQIYLQKFEYSTLNNFFKSVGKIKIEDSKENIYNFSQIYIDEKKREIIGTDAKAFINQKNFKTNYQNKPRIFSNTVKIDEQQSEFTKSIFTPCNYRENDKCPPWSLQAERMRHDKIKKTIYYDNAVIKVFDIPILYLPYLSQPDPTVARRSGFLNPSFSDSKNLGMGFEMPYFWDINEDKDFTLTGKIFSSEHPLFLGEYRQAFNNSNLIFDFGYTEGYKNTNTVKKAGAKSHFFSKFVKNFKGKNNSENNLEFTLQNVSDNKYLKLYKIKNNLVEYETDSTENSFNFTHENQDLFIGFNASRYETLNDNYNDKYEYILPDIILDKNLLSSSKFGTLDFQSNLNVHNYDTNKFTKFIINDFDWKSKDYNFLSGFNSSLLGKFKNVNYEAKNTAKYKNEPTNEIFGALGYLTEIDFYKKTKNSNDHYLKPKMLVRYAPGHMREEENGSRLNNLNIFSLDRLSSNNNFESGLSATLGFDYDIKNLEKDRELNFSIGQVINEKENNNMPASSSLDQRFSDVIGSSQYKLNDSVELNYNFALDQNYSDLNYNEVGTTLKFGDMKMSFNYLEEKEHIGNQEYLNTNIELAKSDNGLLSFQNKRNLITDSSEFYNLSYEYINDCLKAGLVYRREFYNDSEIESENSLMFKITLMPLGDINSPSFGQ